MTALTPGQDKPKAGQWDLINQALTYDWSSVLDIGAGSGWVSRHFLAQGRRPSATFLLQPDPEGAIVDLGAQPIDRMPAVADGSVDAVWASHVLEHTHNTGLALAEMRRVLAPGGWLFLSVPPFKHNVVGGHVNVGWNLGLLAYVLAVHGFDARTGAFVRHGYNLAAFVRRGDLPAVELRYDRDDLERLQPYLPAAFPIRQGVDGDVAAINWRWRVPVQYRAPGRWRARLRALRGSR